MQRSSRQIGARNRNLTGCGWLGFQDVTNVQKLARLGLLTDGIRRDEVGAVLQQVAPELLVSVAGVNDHALAEGQVLEARWPADACKLTRRLKQQLGSTWTRPSSSPRGKQLRQDAVAFLWFPSVRVLTT